MDEIRIPSEEPRLYGRIRWPERTPCPAALLLHGLASDQRELGELPKLLPRWGIASAAFDLRGHGRSGGERGLLTGAGLRRDIDAMLGYLAGQAGCDGRLAVVGHSVGAAVALMALAGGSPRPACGILLAPPDRLERNLSAPERLLLRLLHRPAGWLRIPHKADYQDILRDPGAREAARREGFLQRSLPMASYPFLVRELDGEALAGRVEQPTLVVLADRDLVLAPEGSRRVHRALAGPSRLVELAGSGHSVLLDGRRAEAIRAVRSWLAEVLDLPEKEAP